MKLLSLVFALLLTLPAGTEAGTTGKIAGVVTDDRGEPLPGANVTVTNTPAVIGAVTNSSGEYFILNIIGGSYTLKASFIGHRDVVVQNVRVSPDFTTIQDFELKAEALEVEALVVTAKAPLIQKDQTSSSRIVASDEIETLPLRGYVGVTGLQAGVTDHDGRLYVRGGRREEVAYYVDGVSQQDLQSGLSNTALNSNAIDQVVVTVGGFDAEYGRVMSGIVNVVTKEGGRDYSGSFEAITDEATDHSWAGAPSYGYNNLDGAFGGPLLPGGDRATFFFSGEFRDRKDRAPRWGVDAQEFEAAKLPGADYKLLQDGILPHHELEGWTGQAKLTFKLNEQANLKVGAILSSDDWQTYSHHYRYNLRHSPTSEDETVSMFAKLTWAVSAKTFFTVQSNAFSSLSKAGDGVHFDDVRAYGRPDGNPLFDPQILFYDHDDPSTSISLDANGFSTGDEGHVFDDYEQSRSTYVTPIDFDITSQIDRNHQIKAGGDLQMHRLRYYRHLFPIQAWRGPWVSPDNPGGFIDVDRYGYNYDYTTREIVPLNSERDDKKEPVLGSLYIQDKIEYEGLVVNIGLRYDYLNANTDILGNEGVPLGGDDTLDSGDLGDNNVYHKLSPRIGLGFPMSDKTMFHVHYGKFFQQPKLEDLYVGLDYLEHKAPTGGYYYAFGNPNLKPEETTAYEVGVNQQIGERASIGLTAYYKGISNLVEVTTIPSIPSSFSSFRNRDFGTVKGLDFTALMQRSDRLTMRVNYSLSYATGTGSSPETQRNIAWTFQPGVTEPPKTSSALDFDQRHNLTANIDFRFANDDGPAFMGGRPLSNTGFNLLVRAGSGFPYTPTTVFNQVTLANVQEHPVGPLNSAYGPWQYRVDGKANKKFVIGGYNANLYIWAINLFDRMNVAARDADNRGVESQVYSATGSPLTTGWLSTPEGADFLTTHGVEGRQSYEVKELDPRNFATPRQVRLGLSLSF